MTKIRIEVDDSLKYVLEHVQKEVSEVIKKKYHIDEVVIFGTIASKVLAAKYNHDKKIEFEIDKINSKKGILKVI